MSSEWSSDINVVSGVLKLWFRELPEPLLTYGLYDAFIEAASEFHHSSAFQSTWTVLTRRVRQRPPEVHQAAWSSQQSARPELRDSQVLHGPP
jgi:hypothetical protein